MTFHGVGAPARPLEPDEGGTWVSRDAFLDVLDAAAAAPDVRVFFDDGNASDLDEALPALRDRGLHATFFVVAGRLGARGFLDPRGVRELADAGMSIGSHGMRHRRWRGLDDDALHEELVDARRRLEDVVGRPVTEAACPFGSYDRHVLRRLRMAGYERVYTSDGGAARRDGFLQARTSVQSGDSGDLLERIATRETAPHRSLPRRTKLMVKRWR